MLDERKKLLVLMPWSVMRLFDWIKVQDRGQRESVGGAILALAPELQNYSQRARDSPARPPTRKKGDFDLFITPK